MKPTKIVTIIAALCLLGAFNVANANGASCTGHSCNTTTTNNEYNNTTNKGGEGGTGIAAANSTVRTDVDVKNSVTGLNLQGQDQTQKQYQEVENSNNAKQKVELKVEGDTYKAPDIPVATAIGPSMSPGGNCMGVATGGVQAMSVGVSFGKSYESTPCNLRELARMFAMMGEKKAAMQVLCSHTGAEVTDFCSGKVEVATAPVSIPNKETETRVETVPAVFEGVFPQSDLDKEDQLY